MICDWEKFARPVNVPCVICGVSWKTMWATRGEPCSDCQERIIQNGLKERTEYRKTHIKSILTSYSIGCPCNLSGYTFDGFEEKRNKGICEALYAIAKSGHGFILHSGEDRGVGKTRLAVSVVGELLIRNPKLDERRFKFVDVANWTRQYFTLQFKEVNKWLDYIVTRRCLILDDLGYEDEQKGANLMRDILDERYRLNLQTLITYNGDVKTFTDRYTSKIFDRYNQNWAKLSGKSYRGRK